ncbi:MULTISPECIES: helix-turn-helix domain-containing protein [Nocardia]|uniref:helix-turn-helix domain-containing protein n=1 Tax=Nocardia TaxID=1817 RepID=UPI003556F78A
MTTATTQWLTAAEVARAWRITAREVQRMAARGEIAHMRIGNRIRISADTVRSYERTHTKAARSQTTGR